MNLRVTVDIDASPARVWEVLTNVEQYPEWAASMTSVERLDPGPLRVGSRVRIKQPRLPVAVWEVVDLEPEHGFAWRSRATGVTTIAGHRLDPQPGKPLTVSLSIDQHGPLAPLISVLTRGLTRRYLDLECAGLREQSERWSSA